MPDYPPLPPRPEFKTRGRLFATEDPYELNRPKTRIDDPAGTFRGKYDTETIRTLIAAAKKHNVDPATVLAMGIQETGLSPDNPLQYNFPGISTPEQQLEWETIAPSSFYGAQKYARDADIDAAVGHLKSRMASRGPNAPEEEQIQAYNGMGKLSPKRHPRMYGMDTKNLPPNFYGKRIQEVRERVVRPALKGLLSLANY